ncbi:MAG: hypothetical protein QOJ70_1533 [Acidobacteriota bacterium]|jgi:hypothetical protein|nr:hypothetical protein [Acidobacteriota bacterium]MDT7807720.1 hypothetical protein [Acidobacteriota bacterium]
MSELNEQRWAVLSERGCEQAGLSYEEAAALVARLRGERVHGLCVITDEAASRLERAKKVNKKSPAANNSKAAPKPRRSRKKNA